MTAALEIRGLRKTYRNGIVALSNVDLTIDAGDFFGLIGANGAGKSTLIGCLTGLIVKDAGQLSVYGIDLDKNPYKARQLIGIVPQEFNFNIFEKLENILVNQAGYFGIPRSEALTRAEELLNQLGLWEKRREEARHLSGGLKRRLMIARALMHHPRFLLLDEPTAGVDVEIRRKTWEYLSKLNTEGTTILLTSHYFEEIEQLCRHAALIQQGKILTVDSVMKMIQSLDQQVYIAKLSHFDGLEHVSGYTFTRLDDTSLEVIIGNEDTLTHFIAALHHAGIVVRDLRPKHNRLEQLFFRAKSD